MKACASVNGEGQRHNLAVRAIDLAEGVTDA
jgi:hypothetical protein